jgi:hypothetical protein
MSKLAVLLAGILLGMLITLYHVRSERDHELGLGPQVGHAVADYDDNDWPPCVDMASSERGNRRSRTKPLVKGGRDMRTTTKFTNMVLARFAPWIKRCNVHCWSDYQC